VAYEGAVAGSIRACEASREQCLARWLSILFYLGIAADHVGKPSADLHCLGRHVYHERHFIVCDEQEARAVLDVPGAQLDYREEFQRGEAPWYVVLSR
jgi:hypothetical protein